MCVVAFLCSHETICIVAPYRLLNGCGNSDQQYKELHYGASITFRRVHLLCRLWYLVLPWKGSAKVKQKVPQRQIEVTPFFSQSYHIRSPSPAREGLLLLSHIFVGNWAYFLIPCCGFKRVLVNCGLPPYMLRRLKEPAGSLRKVLPTFRYEV